MRVEEAARVAMPAAHVDRAAEHDGVVLVRTRCFGGGEHVDMAPGAAKRRGDRTRDLFRRAVLARVGDEDPCHDATTVSSAAVSSSASGPPRTTSTGHGASWSTPVEMLPWTGRRIGPQPCAPITIRCAWR